MQVKVFGAKMLLFNLKSVGNIKLTLSFQAALPGWQVFIRNLMEDSFVRHNKLTLWTLIKLGLHWLYKLKERSTSSLGTNSLQYTGWCKAKIILVSNYTLQLSVGMEIPQKISLLGESKNQGMATTQLDGWESWKLFIWLYPRVSE